MSSQERLFEAFSSQAEKPALIFGAETYSYGWIDALARAHVGRLERLKIGAGDRVAVFAETSPEAIAVLIGHLRCGVIHVPINTRYRAQETRHILEDSGACAVVVEEGSACAAVLDEIAADAPVSSLRHRLEIRKEDGAQERSRSTSSSARPVETDPAILIYTSGTTGKSKGAALSLRALVSNTLSVMELWRFTAEDRVVLSLPLFHVHGLCLGLTGALLTGATVLAEPRFDAARVVESFAALGATVFMGVPTMYARLLEHLRATPQASTSLRSARLFTSGSAALPADDLEAFERLTGHRILERYGMSETLFTLSNPYDGQRRAGTVGLPVPGCRVRLVDEEGEDVPGETMGELVVESNGMMHGYWGRQNETAASFRGGWFVTGDMGRRDADGYVTILGRKSTDFIKSGGFKISTREIEDVLRRHPLVRDVAVVGAPDRVWGERVVAAVVLEPRSGAVASAEELLVELSSFCARSLADYKRPREVRIVDELPRNTLGKIQKHRILEGG